MKPDACLYLDDPTPSGYGSGPHEGFPPYEDPYERIRRERTRG